MGDGRDVGRKYVGGIGCGSVSAGSWRGCMVGEAGMCRVVFLFCFVSLGCDSSLGCMVCVCVLAGGRLVLSVSFFFDGVSCV